MQPKETKTVNHPGIFSFSAKLLLRPVSRTVTTSEAKILTAKILDTVTDIWWEEARKVLDTLQSTRSILLQPLRGPSSRRRHGKKILVWVGGFLDDFLSPTV